MGGKFPFSYPLSDFLLTLLGLILFLVDLVLDVQLVVSLWQEKAYHFVTVLVILLLSSSALVQIFSWLWYSYDSEEPETRVEKCAKQNHLLFVLHLFQVGVFIRYAAVIEISCRSFRKGEKRLEGFAVYHTHDLSMLRLLETFLESAPQLVLMIQIIIRKGELELLTFIKAGGSAASVAWSVAMYHRSLRSFLPEKDKQGWGSSVVYFLWNLLLIAPRLASLALFASAFPCYAIGHFLILWVPLFIWAWLQKTDFMDSVVGELLYRIVVGIIWYFSWFSVAKGSTFTRSLIYHSFIMVDSGLILLLWCQLEDSADKLPAEPFVVSTIIAISFVLGLILKIIYYKRFHPKNPEMQTGGHDEVQLMMVDEVDFRSLPEPSVEVVTNRRMETQVAPVRTNKRMRNLAANFYSSSRKGSEHPPSA